MTHREHCRQPGTPVPGTAKLMILAALIFAMTGCGALSDADDKVFSSDWRRPEPVERLFLALASDIWSEKPCYLIHPESMWIAGFNSGGSKVGYLRSECFADVAEKTKNPALCDKVRSVSTFFQSGASLNQEACIRATSSNSAVSRHLDMPAILELAGYDTPKIDALFVSKGRFTSPERAAHFRDNAPGIYWSEVRQYVIASPEFFARIHDLPGFASEADREAMRRVTWLPRYRRDLPLPEERSSSPRLPEVRIELE